MLHNKLLTVTTCGVEPHTPNANAIVTVYSRFQLRSNIACNVRTELKSTVHVGGCKESTPDKCFDNRGLFLPKLPSVH